jgi:fatty acid desaturase
MKNNLENLRFNEVTDQSGRSYAEFRKQLFPNFRTVRADLLKGYFFLVLILADAVILSRLGLFNWILLVAGAFICGYCLAYLHLFIHEAAHYNIHPDRQKNDRICNFFIGMLFGIDIKNYRKLHWLHHQHLGTTSDTEHSYYHPLDPLFLLTGISGVQAVSVMLERAKRTSRDDQKKSGTVFIAYTLFFHLLLLSVLFYFGGWMVAAMWLIGLLSVFPLFAALRQLLEHRDASASGKTDFSQIDHGKTSRLFGDNFIDSSFGAAGFNKHLIHHWDPVISYTRLKDVEQFLLNCTTTAENIRQSKTGYLKIFVSLFKFH